MNGEHERNCVVGRTSDCGEGIRFHSDEGRGGKATLYTRAEAEAKVAEKVRKERKGRRWFIFAPEGEAVIEVPVPPVNIVRQFLSLARRTVTGA